MQHFLIQHLSSLIWLSILIIFFIYFCKQYLQLRAISKWPCTEGEIVHFEMRQERNRLWPEIEYRYCIKDEEYCCAYFFADTIHNSLYSQYSRKLAYSVAMAYKEGQPLTVYYNPENPEQAVLDKRIPPKLVVLLISLLCLILLETGLLLFA